MTWRYGVIKRGMDDGFIYGLHEFYFTDGLLQSWTENPYWTEQDVSDFYVTLDKLELRFKCENYKPEWAFGYDDEDYKKTLKLMRGDIKKPVFDEEEQMRKWDEH